LWLISHVSPKLDGSDNCFGVSVFIPADKMKTGGFPKEIVVQHGSTHAEIL
jgi:hypothetical protein